MPQLHPPHTGDLELRPLPAVLLDLHEHGATGRLIVCRDQVTKTIDVVDGDFVAIAHHDETDERIAAAAAQQRMAEIRYRLLSPLRWASGSWRFEPRKIAPGLRISIPEVVLRGLHETANEGASPSQILADMFLALTLRGARLLPLLRSVFGVSIPDRLPENVTARELTESGLTSALLDAMILTDAVVPTLPAVGPALTLRAEDLSIERSPLYSELFESHSVVPHTAMGRTPIQLEGADDFDDDDLLDDEATRCARSTLVAEALRVRDLDHYAVLMVDHAASDLAIAAALAEKERQFSRSYYARFPLGRDASLLDDIHGAFHAARAVLLDDDQRRSYDRDLAGGDLSRTDTEAERLLEAGLDLLRRGEAAAAAAKIEASLAARPDHAEALAALGWALWHQGGRSPAAADLARIHLGKALRAKPNSGTANEYLGLVELAIGADEHAALDYLERAARTIPCHAVVLEAVAKIYQRHGRHRGLERFYRRLLRDSGRPPHDQAALWQRLGVLYSDHLDDPDQANHAFAMAARLGGLATPPRRSVPAAPTRNDADFIAASLRVATGDDSETDRALYEQWRPRTLPRARCTMSRELWNLLRHPADETDIGALAELLAPAAQSLHPVTLADLAVDPSACVPDHELPVPFARLRAYAAELLGLPTVPVYAHPDFGADVHVGATQELVLLAGDDALTAPERPELGFRIARATTYLWPGRAVGASRPARVMRTLFLSLYRETTGTPVDEDDPERTSLAILDPDIREQARSLVLRLLARSPNHNLSLWAQSLGRTADRFGLLVCGDVPVAIRLASSLTANGDLLDFARSPEFLALRAALGLTVTSLSLPNPPRGSQVIPILS